LTQRNKNLPLVSSSGVVTCFRKYLHKLVTNLDAMAAVSENVSLEARVAALEKRVKCVPHNLIVSAATAVSESTDIESLPPAVARVARDLLKRGVLGSALVKVPADYYDRSLKARAEILTTIPEKLCKTIVLKNSVGTTTDPSADVAQHQYIAVVLQYVSKLATDLLEKWIKSRLASKGIHVPEVKLTLAAEGCELTGFSNNAISVFGMQTHIPVIISKQITQLNAGSSIWLGTFFATSCIFIIPFRMPYSCICAGGGEVDVKCRVFVSQLTKPGIFSPDGKTPGPTYSATVLDCAYPRGADDIGDE
jgi:hypothetical protein